MSSANKSNLVSYDGEICISGYIHFDIDFIVKLREREGQGVDLGRSLKGHLYIVDVDYCILSLMLYTKFGCHPPTHLPSTASLLISRIKSSMDQVK